MIIHTILQTTLTAWLLVLGSVALGVLSASLTDPSTFSGTSFDTFVTEHNIRDKYDHEIFLGPDNNVAVFWKLVIVEEDDNADTDTATSSSTLYLAVASAASGWVGFGISDAGAMPGADIIVYETATNLLQDYYATAFVRPTPDVCASDWTMTGSVVYDGQPFLAFEAYRLVDTGDPQDRALIDDSSLVVPPTPIIVAWGDEEDGMAYHGPNRARTTVRFFKEGDQAVESNEDILESTTDGSFFITANNYTIPQDETTYHDFCVNLNDIDAYPAELGTLIHLVSVGVAPSLERNGVDTFKFVHHFAAFGRRLPCEVTENNPRTFFYGWGPGQDPLVLPDDVGIPLGGDRGFVALALQIHYDNPGAADNILDDTGIQVHYALIPRAQEAQAMVIGDGSIGLAGASVGAGAMSHQFDCPSSCTASHFASPVTVFAEALHLHETGTRGVSQVRRAGKLFHEADVDVWDFRRNGIKLVQQATYELQPGDEFRTFCYTQNADNSTVFGKSTKNEMCQAILWFYPAIMRSHGFCGYNFPDPQCSAVYMESQAPADFGRYFGSVREECPAPRVSSGGLQVVSWSSFALLLTSLVTGFFGISN
jgi:hypothetical protein